MTSNKQFKKDARELAAREGISYTDACWRLRNAAAPATAPTEAARYGWAEVTVDALSEIVAEHGVVPVTVIWDEEARRTMVQRDSGVRWGVAEPAVDGYVIREVPDCHMAVEKGTRVPVPHRLPDGRVAVAAVWPVVWQSNSEPFWRFVHNGWDVERPGDFPAGLDPMCPSRDLPYEVRTYDVPDGVLGEDHSGGAPGWWTRAWCTDLDKARELADAFTAYRLGASERPAGGDFGCLRAEVWRHSTTNLVTLPARVHRADAAPDRPVAPQLPFDTWPAGRPKSATPTPEPSWYPGEKHPPTYELKVWREDTGWVSFAWVTGGRSGASLAAARLRVGTGGPYAFAETWGPRHPDAWAHDWTQEGRVLTDHHPDMPYAERDAWFDARRQEKEDHLVASLAARSRGALTVEQAAERLRAGGEEYRGFLETGSACIARALNTARRAAEGEGRLRLREALDALERRNEVAEGVIDIVDAYLATDPDAHFSAGAQAYMRRALAEYLAPGSIDEGVPGLSTA
ncbi:hypothetical protein [Streptomyces sp. NPDC053048]|uniref:hypothetical protein n=1 Tax=Streptomyces sp. NPDC053048 TaxID=3365694 RepID=UPI0037D8016F